MASRIDIIFDVTAQTPYYQPTLDAVIHAAAAAEAAIDLSVVRTDKIDGGYLQALPDALVIGPGSPYDKPAAAELVVRAARERGVPLVGT